MTIFATLTEQDDFFRSVVAPNCPECGSNPCYRICPRSPRYYSAEQEREDTRWNDSLSHDEWFRLAVVQYEQVHGEAYCS